MSQRPQPAARHGFPAELRTARAAATAATAAARAPAAAPAAAAAATTGARGLGLGAGSPPAAAQQPTALHHGPHAAHQGGGQGQHRARRTSRGGIGHRADPKRVASAPLLPRPAAL